MKTNLLLLDSYVDIDKLVSVAFSFSKRTNANLKIIYVFDFVWMRQSYMVGTAGPVDPSLVAIENNAREEYDVAEKKIKEVVADYQNKNEVNIQHEVYVSELNRIDVINEEWEKNNDLLLMISTRQSYTEASGGLIGYPDLLSHVKCPILAFPEDIATLEWKNVLYATDFNSSDIKALRHLNSLVNSSAQITIVHVAKESEFDENLEWTGFQEKVKEAIDNTGLNFKLEKNDKVEDGIQNYLNQHNADIIAVLKEKKGFFKQIFSSSETKHILTKFDKPLLIYHES